MTSRELKNTLRAWSLILAEQIATIDLVRHVPDVVSDAVGDDVRREVQNERGKGQAKPKN